MNFLEHRHSLQRQRHNMLHPALHFSSRDSPLGFLKIDLRPFCLPELSGPDKHERGKLQGTTGDNAAYVIVNRVQKAGNFFWPVIVAIRLPSAGGMAPRKLLAGSRSARPVATA